MSNASPSEASAAHKRGRMHLQPEDDDKTKHASNGVSDKDAHEINDFYGHNRQEVTRIIIQSLSDLGYQSTANQLSQESGFELEVPNVAAFRTAVQSGNWVEAEALLFGSSGREGLPLCEGAKRDDMVFLMRQQKYLELLELRDLSKALMVLRQELTPLHHDVSRLHALSSLIMCRGADDLRQQARWDGANGSSRKDLLSELSRSISPSVMIPEHRLAVLLDHVQQQHIDQCLYHNTTQPPSLLHDHVCEREQFPLHIFHELQHHSDEVWHLEFSHNGSMLATASKDNTVVIYDTTSWMPICRLGQQKKNDQDTGVCYVSWSPDDTYILTCSQSRELAIHQARTGTRVGLVDHFHYPVTTAAWAPDGQSFVVGSQDSRRPLALFQLSDLSILHSWISHDAQSLRVNDCAISADGSRLVAISNDNRVIVYDFKTRLKVQEWVMEDRLTCVSLSRDGKSLLVSMNEGRLVLLNLDTGEVLQRYTGLTQSEFVIRSGFGGAGENFVISGSEDSRVYVWRKHTGQLVVALEAHPPGTVNSVAWHPTNPAIFASAGDDRRVRIWSNRPTDRRRSSFMASIP
ncbi:WD domain-containing protein [Aureobasidium pullulans]|uniref:WD domain-containing protein n=1 Tax=Aureobasidium pullulans TaxID=5580 RepID=A0A4S9A519_AURPU|nr:WD domain-containing protein [Aureobasidium pullulans]